MALSACDFGQFTVGTTAKLMERAGPAMQQESDYQLAYDSIPGSLKAVEGFWLIDPENEILLRLLTEGYCQYGTGFVEDDWEVAKFAKKLDEIAYHSARATTIFTRCLNYALKQLGERWQTQLFESDDVIRKLTAETPAGKRDQMMWVALALGSIVNHNLSRADMLGYLPTIEIILSRVLELDRASLPARKDLAALPHVAQGMLASARSKQLGGDDKKALAAFEMALKLTDGKLLLARTLMAYRLGIMNNDRPFFHAQLRQVLETAPSIWPEQRLANEIAHRRARRYLSHEKELFE